MFSNEAVTGVGTEAPVLVAHSTACALFGHLVGAPHRWRFAGSGDTEARSYPRGPQAFAPMPLHLLSFPTIVVASRNDPAVSFNRARFSRNPGGSELIDLGAAGHVNEKCGYGPWLDGHELVERLLRGKSDPVSVDRRRGRTPEMTTARRD